MDSEPLSTPPPLPPQLSPRFHLVRGAWIAWGAFALLKVILFFTQSDSLDAEAIGRQVGAVIGALLWPMLIAWIVWRLGGRSARAANVTFFAMFAVVVFSHLLPFIRRSGVSDVLSPSTKESRAASVEPTSPTEQKPQDAPQRAQKQLTSLAANATGEERLVAEGAKVYMDKLLEAKTRYETAMKQLPAREEFWKLEGLDDANSLLEQRHAVQTFAEANTALALFQDKKASNFRRELEARGASADTVRQAVEAYRKSIGARSQLIGKMRETDAQIAQAMLDLIDFAASNRGKWRIDASSGKLVLANDAMVASYQAIVERSRAAGAAQTKAKNDLATPK